MTDRGDYILVDATDVQAALPEIIRAVEEQGRRVQIVRNGKPIVELSPVKPGRRLLPPDPRHKVVFVDGYDPAETL